VLTRLRAHYGTPEPRRTDGALAELVQTILSQNTSDVNTERAFASLWARFGAWQAILEAPTLAVADAIRSGGLAEIKAPRIQGVLAAIQRDRGELSLEFLAELPLDEARAYLTSLGGVGPKTAACVLLFALGRPDPQVDTHVYRVGSRLGLWPEKASFDLAHDELARLVGDDPQDAYEIHVLLIRHGRRTCTARAPACADCPLKRMCPEGRRRLAAA
jgi:endonuclease III